VEGFLAALDGAKALIGFNSLNFALCSCLISTPFKGTCLDSTSCNATCLASTPLSLQFLAKHSFCCYVGRWRDIWLYNPVKDDRSGFTAKNPSTCITYHVWAGGGVPRGAGLGEGADWLQLTAPLPLAPAYDILPVDIWPGGGVSEDRTPFKMTGVTLHSGYTTP